MESMMESKKYIGKLCDNESIVNETEYKCNNFLQN